MTMPDLPPPGSVDWYAHYEAMDEVVRGIPTAVGMAAAESAADADSPLRQITDELYAPALPTGRTLHLSTDGSDDNDGLSPTRPRRTFIQTLPLLQPGDTLLVEEGVYAENVSGLTLVPGEARRPITVKTRPNLTGSKATISGLLWLTAPSYWRLENLAVTWNPDIGTISTHMVKMTDGVGWVVEGCEFYGAQSYAAFLVTSSDGSLNAWTVRGCYIHDTGVNNDANQDHNLYINTGKSLGFGLVERNLLVGAPNGENIKMDGASAGVGTKNVVVRYNTLIDANHQNILIGSGSSGNRIYRNLISGTAFRAIRGYNLTGAGNRVWKNWAWGGSALGTLFAYSDTDDPSYVGLDIGAGNVFADPILVDATITAGYTGYRPTDQVAKGYGHLAPAVLDDTDTPIYTQAMVPTELPSGAALQANMTGALSAITDDPDNVSDSTWRTAINPLLETRVTVGFDTPANLVDGSALQRVRVRVRRTAGSVPPHIYVQLLENGTLVRSLTSAGQSLLDSPVRELFAYFSLSELTDKTGAGVQIRIISTPEDDPLEPVGDCTGEVASIRWDAAVTSQPITSTINVSSTPTPAYNAQPPDHGFKGWTMDPMFAASGQLLVSGTLYASRIRVPVSGDLTNLLCYVTVAGSGLTYARMGLYDVSGSLIGQTADLSSVLSATGAQVCPLVSPVAFSGEYAFLSILTVGTTPPTIARAASTSAGAVTNIGLTTSQLRAGTKTSQAALPSSLGTPGSSNLLLFMAVS